MTDIQELERRLREARAEADKAEATHRTARDGAERARDEAARHEQAAVEARLFGVIPTRETRRHERLAAEAREAVERHDRAEREAAPAMQEAQTELRSADEELVTARRVETDQEIQRLARIGEAIQSDVTNGILTWEEAYGDGVIASEEVHARYEQALGDEKDEDFWGTSSDDTADDGYAEAAADAHADQLAVRDLDLSIDAGIRTYEEVYTPEGDIRQHLLQTEEPEQETPEAPAAETESEKRERGFEFDEPF